MAQKYALVVGCNFPGDRYQLNGSINDALSMQDMLITRFGFTNSNVQLLTDEPSSTPQPTAEVIKRILMEFCIHAKAGDLVFFFFAGHGTIVPPRYSPSHKHEQAIVASDKHYVTRVDFREILSRCGEGVQFVVMSDSCHSGGLLDKDKEQDDLIDLAKRLSNRWINSNVVKRVIPFEAILQKLGEPAVVNISNQSRYSSRNLHGAVGKPLQGILISGCQPQEDTNETEYEDGKYRGVFTTTVLDVLKTRKVITYRNLVAAARIGVGKKVRDQHPCLYCNDKSIRAYFLEYI